MCEGLAGDEGTGDVAERCRDETLGDINFSLSFLLHTI